MVDEGFGPGRVLDKADGADFVEVMFAKTLEEAKECCRLLEDVHIACRYETDRAEPGDRGVAILVPEESLIEASELLSAREQNEVIEEEEELDMTDEDDIDEFEDTDEDDDEVDDDEDDDEFDDDGDEEDDDEDELDDVY